MTSNAIAELARRDNRDHMMRQDAISLQKFIEDVANNMRNFEINKEKNAIEKLAKDQLNEREIAALAQKTYNDAMTLLEKEKQRLSNEDIEAAKREIERYRAETERLLAESETLVNSKQPEFEKERNRATIINGITRGLGGVSAALASILVKGAGHDSLIKPGQSLASLIRSKAPTSPAGVSNLLKSLSATATGKAVGQNVLSLLPKMGYAGAGLVMLKLGSAIQDTDYARRNVARYHDIHQNVSNPSEATKIDDEGEEAEEYQNIDQNSPLRDKSKIIKKEKNYETVDQQKTKYEIPRDRGPISEGSSQSTQNGEESYQQQSVGRSSNIIYSPSTQRSSGLYGPGLS